MPDPVFDKKEQLATIQGLLLDGESVDAVFDCKGAGTGFIGITSKRVIYFDKAFMSNKKVISSLPYSRIASIATEGETGFFGGTSKLFLTTLGGSHIEFDFRGADKAKLAHTMVLTHLLAREETR